MVNQSCHAWNSFRENYHPFNNVYFSSSLLLIYPFHGKCVDYVNLRNQTICHFFLLFSKYESGNPGTTWMNNGGNLLPGPEVDNFYFVFPFTSSLTIFFCKERNPTRQKMSKLMEICFDYILQRMVLGIGTGGIFTAVIFKQLDENFWGVKNGMWNWLHFTKCALKSKFRLLNYCQWKSCLRYIWLKSRDKHS